MDTIENQNFVRYSEVSLTGWYISDKRGVHNWAVVPNVAASSELSFATDFAMKRLVPEVTAVI